MGDFSPEPGILILYIAGAILVGSLFPTLGLSLAAAGLYAFWIVLLMLTKEAVGEEEGLIAVVVALLAATSGHFTVRWATGNVAGSPWLAGFSVTQVRERLRSVVQKRSKTRSPRRLPDLRE